MRVLHVILTLERAGAQEVIRLLSRQLAGTGCETMVCTFIDGPFRRDLEALGIDVLVLGPRRYGVESPLRFVAELGRIRRRLARLVRDLEIDIVQTHLLQTLDFLVLGLRSQSRSPAVLWTIHNVDFLPRGVTRWTKLKQRAHAALYRLTAGRTAGVIAVSEGVRIALIERLGRLGGRLVTIANGVDPERFNLPGDAPVLRRSLGISGPASLILTVGRLAEQKGHCFLLDAAAAVVRVRPEAHFLLAGEGELEPALREQARRMGLAANIHFLGQREDVPWLLASADVFVLPSLWEGLSVALLEAMAAGCPVIATDVSGTDQAMVPGETGLVVPPADSGALTDALLGLLSDRDAARAMGRRARCRAAERFSARDQARRYLALYNQVLHEPVGGRP